MKNIFLIVAMFGLIQTGTAQARNGNFSGDVNVTNTYIFTGLNVALVSINTVSLIQKNNNKTVAIFSILMGGLQMAYGRSYPSTGMYSDLKTINISSGAVTAALGIFGLTRKSKTPGKKSSTALLY